MSERGGYAGEHLCMCGGGRVKKRRGAVCGHEVCVDSQAIVIVSLIINHDEISPFLFKL